MGGWVGIWILGGVTRKKGRGKKGRGGREEKKMGGLNPGGMGIQNLAVLSHIQSQMI